MKLEEFVPIFTGAYLLNYYKKSWMLDQIKVNQNNITGVTVCNFLLIESLKIKKIILVLLPAFSTHIDKIQWCFSFLFHIILTYISVVGFFYVIFFLLLFYSQDVVNLQHCVATTM